LTGDLLVMESIHPRQRVDQEFNSSCFADPSAYADGTDFVATAPGSDFNPEAVLTLGYCLRYLAVRGVVDVVFAGGIVLVVKFTSFIFDFGAQPRFQLLPLLRFLLCFFQSRL
jgi:hypothetical protein